MPSGRKPLGNEIVVAKSSAEASCGDSARASAARPYKLVRFDIDILRLEFRCAGPCAGARRIDHLRREIDGRDKRESRYERQVRCCHPVQAWRGVDRVYIAPCHPADPSVARPGDNDE